MADEENETQNVAEPPQGGLKKMLIFGGGAVVLLAVGILAGPAIQNMISGWRSEY